MINMVNQAQSTIINVNNKLVDLKSPRIMGIINLTSDSFYDGGKYNTLDNALKRAASFIHEGANIIDVGAYSSRPGAVGVSEAEECSALVPFIESLHSNYPDAIISVDTFRAAVADKAVKAGASIINDVSGGTLDPLMFETVAKLGVPYILMHMRGTPKNMQNLTDYDDLLSDIFTYFIEKLEKLRKLGVKDIILDPGFGFAKSLEQNYVLLNRFDEFLTLGCPLIGAVSRKSMISNVLNKSSEECLNGTSVLNTILLLKGASILRVHDVVEAKEVALLIKMLKENA